MATRKKQAAPGDLGPMPGWARDALARFFLRAEVGDDWGERWEELALCSPVVRELLRLAHAVEDQGPDAMLSLARLWQAAGSPADKDPRAAYSPGVQVGIDGHSIGTVEDRGEAGLFGCWETAVWFAHELDPERFDPGDVCELLY